MLLRGFNNDSDAVRIDGFADGQSNLFRQSLLDLQASTVDLHNSINRNINKNVLTRKNCVMKEEPGQFGESEYFAIR